MFPHLTRIYSLHLLKLMQLFILAENCVTNDGQFIKVTWWTLGYVPGNHTGILLQTLAYSTCSMPGLSGLRSGLVSTCSGMSLQPTRGISSQCLRTVRAKCSSVCFFRPVSQMKLISFHILYDQRKKHYKHCISSVNVSPLSSSISVGPRKMRFPTLTLPPGP